MRKLESYFSVLHNYTVRPIKYSLTNVGDMGDVKGVINQPGLFQYVSLSGASSHRLSCLERGGLYHHGNDA